MLDSLVVEIKARFFIFEISIGNIMFRVIGMQTMDCRDFLSWIRQRPSSKKTMNSRFPLLAQDLTNYELSSEHIVHHEEVLNYLEQF